MVQETLPTPSEPTATKRLRIIFGTTRAELEEHAKEHLLSQRAYDKKNPHRVQPRGVPYHLTQYPLLCDDCGETYWSRDEYGAHLKCNKGKGATGF